MKKIALSSTLVTLVLLAFFLSCEKTSDDPKQNPVFLKDAHQIAHDTKGFYLQKCDVAVVKDSENDQKRLQLVLNQKDIKPYMINVFLEEKDWKNLNIESGTFELLFMKHALIVRDPLSDKQYSFTVENQELEALKNFLPNGLLSKSSVKAIGIAVYGNQ